MPLPPTSFLPQLLQQLFNKYIEQFSDKTNQDEIVNSTDFKQFLIELDTIFGEVLSSALRLLDEQQITVYHLESQIRELVEITEGRNSARVIKLFPDVNYCTCDYFAQHVLKLEPTSPYKAAPSDRSDSYTCAHILALHLAKLLRSPAKREVIVPKHKFNILLQGMQPTDDR